MPLGEHGPGAAVKCPEEGVKYNLEMGADVFVVSVDKKSTDKSMHGQKFARTKICTDKNCTLDCRKITFKH